ncbi:MAG TPA: response regulator [Stellaceae bacterium]|nr:response regulator [Stellaceae bacterium]
MNLTPHLLIVDDDSEICALLSNFLEQTGYRVSVATDGGAMMQTLASAKIDLVVLDIMLPGKDGLALCRELRAAGRLPIIMLTAIDGEADRVVGLEMGADDYLTKPFSPRELVARIRAVLRRVAGSSCGAGLGADKVYEFAGWSLDVARRQLISPAGSLVMLRTAEFDILLALVERPQRTLTRDQLLDLARGRALSPFDRAIDVHISRLRKRIEADPKEPEMIRTVRSEGYYFAVAVTASGATP